MSRRLNEEAIASYRYVRVSLVAAVALLFIALLVQIVRDQWVIDSSISAYYYSPVRSVFVGTLVAAALALVAIRGRPGGEDALLNLVGMLSLLVAFFPTPIEGTPEAPCPRDEKCIPEEFLPGVEVSVTALIVLGFVALAFSGWTLAYQGWADRAAGWGLGAAGALWAVFAVWFGPTPDWGPRARLLDIGHYAAAIPMFVLLVVVALINARKTMQDMHVARVRVSYKAVYRSVAAGMAMVIVAALAYWVIVIRVQPAHAEHSMIFWVEVSLLALFAIFWTAQTAQFWDVGLPEEALELEPPAVLGMTPPDRTT